jgi:hypothetical protein
MVSPVEKQGASASELSLVSPDGDAVGFLSEGAFADPANWALLGATVRNSYLARYEGGQWRTESAFAPSGLIQAPDLGGPLAADFTAGLGSTPVACGGAPSGGDACAIRRPDGTWVSTPSYWPTHGLALEDIPKLGYVDVGQSEDLSRVFLEPGVPLVPDDHLATGGLYELSDLGGVSPRLRLVNVASNGTELGLSPAGDQTPLLGDSAGQNGLGTADHAISASGETVFFTATPAGGSGQTVYARRGGTKTVAVSGAQDCGVEKPRCEPGSERPATFQGASADGSKAFFTSEQNLIPGLSGTGMKLYEYAFAPEIRAREHLPASENLIALSGDTGEAGVEGVVRSSPDGSHVYFVATSVLAGPNGLGQEPHPNENNLYVADTDTGELSFIAILPGRDKALWGRGCEAMVACDNVGAEGRPAQTNPDGQYLVFSTYAHLDPADHNACPHGLVENGELIEVCNAQAVYRYDAETGALAWLSHPAIGAAAVNEGQSAQIAPLNGNRDGALAEFEDTGRSLSETGDYVVFSTKEHLAAGDAHEEQVYVWHCASPCTNPAGEAQVGLVSDGQHGAGTPIISDSGKDIFFTTSTALVPGDKDELGDVYDARVGGGVEPQPSSACAGEACQPEVPAAPVFGPIGSEQLGAG